MANDVYEDSTLKIKVRLKSNSKKSEDKARLIFTVDGVDEPAITLTVKKRAVEHAHTFAKVPDDANSYVITYRVEHDTETHTGLTYTVWPLVANVKLLNDEDGAALANTDFTLEFSTRKQQPHRTDNTGACEVKLKQKATWGLVDLTRLVFVRWENGHDKGRNREARMRVVKFKAVMEAPAWEGESVVQHVNLKTARRGNEVGHDKQGARVAFTFKLVDADAPDRIVEVPKNEPVYLSATLSNTTKRDARTATLVDVPDLDTATENVIKGVVKTGGDGKARVTLQLGMGGKEKCTFAAGTTDACADAQVSFENKRKIWLQAISLAGAAPGTGDAEGWFANVGIEMLADTAVTLAARDLPKGAIVPGAGFGLAGDVLIVGDHNVASMTRRWTREHTPLSAYAVYCDFQFDAGTKPKTKTVTYPDVTQKAFHVTPLSASNELLVPYNLHTGGCAVAGTWKSQATTGEHKNKKGVIAEGDLTFNWATTREKFTVRLPAEATAVIDGGEKLTVSFKITYALGIYLGWAPSSPRGGVVVALRGDGPPRPEDKINKVIVHELGHLLNQVSAPGAGVALDRDADHGWHYTGRGHSGGHCAVGVDKGTYDGGGVLAGESGTCVMFGEGADSTQGDFCAKCKPFVLAELVESLS